MNLPDLIATIAITVILGLAIFYIVRAKKKGVHCIGCPDAGSCQKNSTYCGTCSLQNSDIYNINLSSNNLNANSSRLNTKIDDYIPTPSKKSF